MRPHNFFSIMLTLIGVSLFLSFNGCSGSNIQKAQDDSTQIKDTVLGEFFLSIPSNLTRNEASKLIEDYVKDSLIYEVNDYSYCANNFEQILAEVNYGDVNYHFETNFVIKTNDKFYKNTKPVGSLIFYKDKLLSLELEIKRSEIIGSPNIQELNDSIISMYIRKYGEPSLKNEDMDTYILGEINSEIDLETTDLDNRLMRTWKENIKSTLTEWTFLNARIKIITSRYKEYLALNYKKEKPTEYIWNTIHIFYINTSTTEERDQDIKNYEDSIELLERQKERANRIKDSLNNIDKIKIYRKQRI